jgi:hypothetical protein
VPALAAVIALALRLAWFAIKAGFDHAVALAYRATAMAGFGSRELAFRLGSIHPTSFLVQLGIYTIDRCLYT